MLLPTRAIEAAVVNGDIPIDHLLVHSCILEGGNFTPGLS